MCITPVDQWFSSLLLEGLFVSSLEMCMYVRRFVYKQENDPNLTVSLLDES